MNSFVVELRDPATRNNLRTLLEFIAESPSPSTLAFGFPRDLAGFTTTIEAASEEQVGAIIFDVYLASFSKFKLVQLDPQEERLAFQTIRTNPKLERIERALRSMILALVLIDLFLIAAMIGALIIHSQVNVKMNSQDFITMELSLACLLVLANVMGCKLIKVEALEPIYRDARNFALWLENVVSIIPDQESSPAHSLGSRIVPL